ncbi:MFS transporter [Methylobacterium sp. C25]|uniref:MFS transporter n=1 Tax=Methylobacterium sp. C25 TaxID=2721622 RepID=UPI001F4598D8|nr:MFS transporter [Methylobacterium sp. C25]MCE4225289.1 MFS transporter [Methylobacterium sp. C25]
MYLVLYMDRVNIGTAAGAIQSDLKLSNTELGLVFSAFAYPYALIQLFGGWAGDRFGPRVTLAICGCIFSVATLLIGFADSLIGLVACRVLLGFGEAPALPTATRAIASWTPPAQWGMAQGLTHAAARVGNALTPPLIALLIGWFSWRGSFFFVATISLAWVITWVAYFRDDPAKHSGTTAEDLRLLPLSGERQKRKKVPVARLLRRILPVTLVDFCYAWTLWVYLNWLPSFFLKSYGLDLKQSALFAGGILCAGIVGDTLGGIWSDRILHRTGNLLKARSYLIAGGLIGSLICLLPVLFLKDIHVVAVALTLAFFCMELVIGPLWSVPMDIAPQYSGTASGFMNFGFAIAGIVSPLAFGFVIDRTGDWHLPFAMSIALLFVGALLTLFMRPDRPFQDDEETVLSPPVEASAAKL